MNLLLKILGFISVIAFLLSAHAQGQPHLKVELLSEQKTIQPGQTLMLGVHFKIEPGWHIYWLNPGDAGFAPSIQWNLPPGFKTGKILWPIPQRITLPSVTEYGYEDEVLLTVPVKVPINLKAGEIFALSAKVDWLVCKGTCIPGSATVTLTLPVKAPSSRPGTQTKIFTNNQKNLPTPLPSTWKASGSLSSKQFDLALRSPIDITNILFFPLKPDQIDNTAPQIFHSSSRDFRLTVQRAEGLLTNVKTIEGLVVVDAKGAKKGYWVKFPLSLK